MSKNTLLPILLTLFLLQVIAQNKTENPLKNTFCNPLNIEYNFWRSSQKAPLVGKVSHREAADPTIIVFKGTYYLFASHSSGYWWSKDLATWNLIVPTTLGNVDAYAPSAAIYNDTLYLTGNGGRKMYCTADPMNDDWKFVIQHKDVGDPCLFVDDDNKVYLYYGLTKGGPISVVQLDPTNHFEKIEGTQKDLFSADALKHGCEAPEGGTENKMAYEGAWMTKHNGKYYLEYAVPGTSSPFYNDSYYVSNSPTGPFTFGKNSPSSIKPTGFVAGAGHGSTFKDLNGNYWHVTTSIVCALYRFERRIALYPAHFDTQGLLYADTYLGDYPQYNPGKAPQNAKNNFTGSMLLSYRKLVIASSSLPGFEAINISDENVKTWWSANTSNKGEWVMLNLEKPFEVGAIQINFAEQDIDSVKIRDLKYAFNYIVECSEKPSGPWKVIIDKSKNGRDLPHDYVPLDKLTKMQYIRVTNAGNVPANGKFAIRALRVFGLDKGSLPKEVKSLTAMREKKDRRMVTIKWTKVDNADGYIIRYGIGPNQLYNHYQILDNTKQSLTLQTLNAEANYYFAIDAYNKSGVKKNTKTVSERLIK